MDKILKEVNSKIKMMPIAEKENSNQLYFTIDKERDGELVDVFENLVKHVTKLNFKKIIVITIDDKGCLRPLFIDPVNESKISGNNCEADSIYDISKKEYIPGQDVFTMTSSDSSAVKVCWLDASNTWRCYP